MTDFSSSPSTYRHPQGLRWQCNGCAKCCSSGLAIGPVEPDVVQGLRDQSIEDRWPQAKTGWLDEQTAPDGEPHFYFQLRDGRCVFLRDDNLCAIHALLGAEAKPGFCREFPYHFVEDARGIAAVIRPACGSFFEGFQTDDEVGQELAGVYALPRVTPRRTWNPPQVIVLPQKAIDTDSWLRVEEALLERLQARKESPQASVAYIRDTLCAILDVSLPTPDKRQYDAALDALTRVLLHILREQQAVTTHGPEDHRQRFLEESVQRVEHARTGARAGSGDEHDYANLLLRSFLLSKGFSNWGGLPEGLGVFLLGLEVAQGAHRADRETFGEHLAEWTRLRDNQMIRALLLRAGAATRDLFLHSGGT